MKKMILLLLTQATLHASDEYFYLNLGFGRGAINYAPAMQNHIDTTFPDASTKALALDLGAYITLNDLLLGATFNSITQSFSNSNSFYTEQYAYTIRGLSAIYFLRSGYEGFFVRGDIGKAVFRASINSTSGEADGTGILLGVGYKWWSLFAAVNMTSYTVKDQDSISGTMLNVGFMW